MMTATVIAAPAQASKKGESKMKVYMIDDIIINLALIKRMNIGANNDCIYFHFCDKDDFVRVDVNKKEVQKIFQECYEIMKKED